MADPVKLRIVRPHDSAESLVEHDAWTVGRSDVLLIGQDALPRKTVVEFEIVLSSGEPVITGAGWALAHEADDSAGTGGLRVKLKSLDRKSKGRLRKMLELQKQGLASRPSNPRPEPASGEAEPTPASSPSDSGASETQAEPATAEANTSEGEAAEATSGEGEATEATSGEGEPRGVTADAEANEGDGAPVSTDTTASSGEAAPVSADAATSGEDDPPETADDATASQSPPAPPAPTSAATDNDEIEIDVVVEADSQPDPAEARPVRDAAAPPTVSRPPPARRADSIAPIDEAVELDPDALLEDEDEEDEEGEDASSGEAPVEDVSVDELGGSWFPPGAEAELPLGDGSVHAEPLGSVPEIDEAPDSTPDEAPPPLPSESEAASPPDAAPLDAHGSGVRQRPIDVVEPPPNRDELLERLRERARHIAKAQVVDETDKAAG